MTIGDMSNLDKIILMKYGVHSGESVSSIIERKIKEETERGFFFWGYSGTLCNPKTQVLKHISESNETLLLLTRTTSDNVSEQKKSTKYSFDGNKWDEIDDKITVFGSKYALICKDLKAVDFDINLCEYVVAVGPSTGINVSDYFRYRVDKVCAKKDTVLNNLCNIKHIDYVAKVMGAVFLQ